MKCLVYSILDQIDARAGKSYIAPMILPASIVQPADIDTTYLQIREQPMRSEIDTKYLHSQFTSNPFLIPKFDVKGNA